MSATEWSDRLSQIETMWTVLQRAHAGTAEAAEAQGLLISRYGKAVQKYLLAALHDPHAADEVFQQFALALVKGNLRHADPEKGRFRAYVKTVLFRLVAGYWRQQGKVPHPVPDSDPALADLAAVPEESERAFLASWTHELLERTWAALASAQPTYHAVLRLRAGALKMSAPEMAAELGRRLGKSLTSDGIRQTLKRAREKFAELLLEEVAHSLEAPTRARLEEELADLGLLEYCRPVLERGRTHPK